MKKKLEILSDLKKRLFKKFGNIFEDIILFGSQINGSASDDSDYDILIILQNDYDWKIKDEIYSECYNIELAENVLFDINIISENELKNSLRGKQPFILNAINSGIKI